MKSETTPSAVSLKVHTLISIHSLNEEWDLIAVLLLTITQSISIHSLNEEWDSLSSVHTGTHTWFQSTHSMKSETLYHLYILAHIHDFNPLTQWRVRQLSLHLEQLDLRFQSTHSMKSETFVSIDIVAGVVFQSTHSMKSETIISYTLTVTPVISIHSLNEEWDNRDTTIKPAFTIFQSTHSMKSETWGNAGRIRIDLFQSTHSMKSETSLP